MALCERCGSIQIARARPHPADKAVALLTSKRPFVCRRCGWRGWRSWTDSDLAQLSKYSSSGIAEVDPALIVLDTPRSKRKIRQDRRENRRVPSEAQLDALPNEFGLSTQDLENAVATEGPPSPTGKTRRRRTYGGLRRSRRSEIVAALAMSALAMFLFAMLGLTGSCSGSTEPL